jgi:hypothetical protein
MTYSTCFREGLEFVVDGRHYRVESATYSGSSKSGLMILSLLDVTRREQTGETCLVHMSVPARPVTND